MSVPFADNVYADGVSDAELDRLLDAAESAVLAARGSAPDATPRPRLRGAQAKKFHRRVSHLVSSSALVLYALRGRRARGWSWGGGLTCVPFVFVFVFVLLGCR